jgi:hypothetical protein
MPSVFYGDARPNESFSAGMGQQSARDRLRSIRGENENGVKAASSLNIPKPTVTKLIQTLETHLGVKLLLRTTRRVTVTPEGALTRINSSYR